MKLGWLLDHDHNSNQSIIHTFKIEIDIIPLAPMTLLRPEAFCLITSFVCRLQSH